MDTAVTPTAPAAPAAATLEPPQEEDDKKDHHHHDVTTPPKFSLRQRVYARDGESGLLYKAVVRRLLYGTAPVKQLRVGVDLMEEQEMESLLKQDDQEPGWHYFVHYLGWNVKWDRWIPESSMFEPNDQTKKLAEQLAKEFSIAKKTKGKNVMMELKRRMQQLEHQQRLEEQKQELGITTPKEKKLNKTNVQKELSLRNQDLDSHLYKKINLSFSLKKILVEEWEIVTQCGMVPTLPSRVTVRQALQQYLDAKLKFLKDNDTQNQDNSDETDKTNPQNRDNNDETKTNPQQHDELSKKQQEYTDMVEGICLFFDQALPHRLLYRQELPQYYYWLESNENQERMCNVYGCEHLLRLTCHLPLLIQQELVAVDPRPVMAKISDLIRFLQKHQSTLFTQSYKRPSVEEQATVDKKRKASSKRKRNVRSKTSSHKEEDDSAVTATAVASMKVSTEKDGDVSNTKEDK